MGKRAAQRRKDLQTKANKKVKTEWGLSGNQTENQYFKSYYKLQLGLSQQQFEIFWYHMKIKLPVVFRINPNYPNYQTFRNKIQSQNFLNTIICKQQLEKITNEAKQLNQPTQIPKLSLIDWYPGNVAFELNTSKQTFKKSKILNDFHVYLQKCFDSGLVSRQQLVSMLPPLYLDLKQTDMVLDMCAAPGSKTSQMIQIMGGQFRKLIKGCIIANDAEYSRAQMLIHQIQRSGTATIVATNHPGQFLPQLFTQKVNNIKEKFQFDKILCDVPCSGDGATRKIPIKWVNWHTSDGMVLHPLQLSILIKAINLLKRGGLLVYSTCSLNPIENQAVVCGLMQKVKCGLQIVNIHKMYKVKGHRGLLKWYVCGIIDKKKQQQMMNQHQKQKSSEKQTNKELKIYQNYQQAKQIYKIKQTMFPVSQQEAKYMGIDNTMRILPHDHNSGGFYVALFKKHQEFQWKYKVNQPQHQKNIKQCQQINQNYYQQVHQKQPQQEFIQKQQLILQQYQQQIVKPISKNLIKKNKKQQKQVGSKYDSYINISQQQFLNIQKFYGINAQLRKLLYVRQNGGSQRKVILVTQSVRKFLQADIHKKIKLVNMGCKVFQKGKQTFAGHQCLYRLCQQGIHFILDYIHQRKVRVPFDFFRTIISQHSYPHQSIQDQQTKEAFKKMSQGSFVVYIDEVINGVNVVDAIVGSNFKNSFHIMVSKQDVGSLSIRYL